MALSGLKGSQCEGSLPVLLWRTSPAPSALGIAILHNHGCACDSIELHNDKSCGCSSRSRKTNAPTGGGFDFYFRTRGIGGIKTFIGCLVQGEVEFMGCLNLPEASDQVPVGGDASPCSPRKLLTGSEYVADELLIGGSHTRHDRAARVRITGNADYSVEQRYV